MGSSLSPSGKAEEPGLPAIAVINLTVEQFGDEVGDSPIVDTDRVVRGFAAITYVF